MTGKLEHFWVDVKTALPEHDCDCLITRRIAGELMADFAFFCRFDDDTYVFYKVEGVPHRTEDIVAWMPIPAPYAPFNEEEEV